MMIAGYFRRRPDWCFVSNVRIGAVPEIFLM
jgi:hypothetical protein